MRGFFTFLFEYHYLSIQSIGLKQTQRIKKLFLRRLRKIVCFESSNGKKHFESIVCFNLFISYFNVGLCLQPTTASANHSNNFDNFPTVSNGSSGNYVKFLQANLDITQNTGDIDGIFGSNTRSAVIAYQRANT